MFLINLLNARVLTGVLEKIPVLVMLPNLADPIALDTSSEIRSRILEGHPRPVDIREHRYRHLDNSATVLEPAAANSPPRVARNRRDEVIHHCRKRSFSMYTAIRNWKSRDPQYLLRFRMSTTPTWLPVFRRAKDWTWPVSRTFVRFMLFVAEVLKVTLFLCVN